MRITVITLCAGLFCGTTFADKEPSTAHLPAAVQSRIKEWKGEGEVKKVKTRKQPNGKTVYEIQYKERGDEKFVVFAEDGSVLSESEGKGGGKGHGKGKKEKNKNNKREKADRDDPDNEQQDQDQDRAVPQPAPGTPIPSKPTSTTRPVTRPDRTGVQTPVLNRNAGETRYIYWDSIPEPVRTAALAQQTQHGSINTKALRVQKKPGNTVYHIPYEKQSVSFSTNGSIFSSAQQSGGPIRPVKWDNLPEPVRNAALAAQRTTGEVKLDAIFSQGNGGKTLHHILFGNDIVHAYSPEGRVQDPATFWR